MRVALLMNTKDDDIYLMWTDGQPWEFAGREVAIHHQYNAWREEFYKDVYCMTDIKTGRTICTNYKTIGGLKRAMKKKEQVWLERFERTKSHMAIQENLMQELLKKEQVCG